MGQKTKRCNRCYVSRTPENTYSDKNTKDGLRSWCKKCTLDYNNNPLERKVKIPSNLTPTERRKRYYQNRRITHPWLYPLHGAVERCTQTKARSYYRYGGRGIECRLTQEEIKELWFRDKAYQLKRPSIDRIDNDGNYSMENCRFIELSENCKWRKHNTEVHHDKE